jgi:DNA-binding transcriptional regulator GbsR (MarR family)
MKLNYYQFKNIADMHAYLSEAKGLLAIEEARRRLGMSKCDFNASLRLLAKLGIIEKLKICSRTFSYILKECERITIELLMRKYGFMLCRQLEGEDKQLDTLAEENEMLKKEIERLNLEISMRKKYGKSFAEKLEDVRVVSGD